MARILNTTVAANGNTDIDWRPLRKEAPNRATLSVFGTFGSGTVALQYSPNGGTTYINVPDQVGNAISFSTNGITNFEIYANGDPISGQQCKLRLALTGATSPSVTYIIDDAR